MKQQINPIVIVVCLVVAIAGAMFLGIRLLNASSATVATESADKEKKPDTINGQKVPDGVPYDYMTRSQGGNAPQGAPR